MTEAEDILLEIANSMNKDFIDPAEHANWAVQVAREYFKGKGERILNDVSEQRSLY